MQNHFLSQTGRGRIVFNRIYHRVYKNLLPAAKSLAKQCLFAADCFLNVPLFDSYFRENITQ